MTASSPPPNSAAVPLQVSAETLVEALLARAEEKGDAEHLQLRHEDGTIERITFAELRDESLAVARGLHARGVQAQETVTLLLATDRDFFVAFLGVLLAGAVPVPIYPPARLDQLEDYASRHVGILRNARVRALITFKDAEPVARLLRPQLPHLELVSRVDKLKAPNRPDGLVPAVVRPADLGLIQYTSGSTGEPKGVTLTHGNLVANIRAIGAGVTVRADDVVISWLPLYHDMGLIGCWLFALYHGLRMVSMSPLAFLRRPKRWLHAFSEERGTLSAAPNFAYELCVRRIHERDLEGVDLSSWRAALNGAEPIQPETLDRFIERFAPYGFDRGALMPVYGLAETAVALTFPEMGRGPRIDHIERDAFQKDGRAVVIADGDARRSDAVDALRFVAVGHALPEYEVRLVDDNDKAVGERREGLIEFRGPSATPGYYRNPGATEELKTPDGWTRTGDLGYFAEGDLFITGRRKDLIIKGGRNVYPQEVEAAAGEIDGVRTGCVAAFSIEGEDGGEQLVVVAESRKTEPEELRRLAHEIKRKVNAVVRVAPDRIEMVPPNTIPKTPSGKLRRRETRQRLLDGNLVQPVRSTLRQVVSIGAKGIGQKIRRLFGKGEA